jgi:Ca2+/H+ antiporter
MKSSERTCCSCVEIAVVAAVCAVIGVGLYLAFTYNQHESHATQVKQSSQTSAPLQKSQVSLQTSKQASSTVSTANNPLKDAIKYVPIRVVHLIPEGQYTDGT